MTKKYLLKCFMALSLLAAAFLITACYSTNTRSQEPEFVFAEEEEEFIPEDPISFETTYEFHSTPVFCQDDEGSNSKVLYVYFGDWPQTKKKAGIVINEEISITRGLYTYYAGSDGNWYAKCLENQFEPQWYKYAYADGTRVKGIEENSYRYFKVEPIKWRVINNINAKGETRAVLVTEQILVGNIRWYDDYETDRFVKAHDARKWEQIYPNDYKHSRVRAYLNGLSYLVSTESTADTPELNHEFENCGFIHTAFDKSAQNLILVSQLENDDERVEDEVLQDKLFLLSHKDVSSPGFILDDKRPVDFALANGTCGVVHSHGEKAAWFLRTPISRDKRSVYAAEDHEVDYMDHVNSPYKSIVPALAVPVEAIKQGE